MPKKAKEKTEETEEKVSETAEESKKHKKVSEEEFEKKVKELAKQGLTSEKIGEKLRKEGGSAAEIGEAYVKAGYLREEARDFINAKTDYRNAKIYGFPYDEKMQGKIDEKMNALILEQRSKNAFDIFKEKEKQRKGKNLGSRLSAVVSMLALSISLFFVTSNLTGNVIAGLNQNNSRFIGICFFICGLIFAFIYSKKKGKLKEKKKSRK